MIKHIFTDMDGTLLNTEGVVSEKTAAALKESKIPVTLVSARAPIEMQPTIDILGLTEPQIAFNGGLIYQNAENGREVLVSHPIERGLAQDLIRDLIQDFPELSVSFYDENRWLAPREDAGTRLEAELTNQPLEVCALEEVFSEKALTIYKIMMIATANGLLERVKAALLERQLDGISVQQSGTQWLEITSEKAKKSFGIEYILEQERLKKEEVAAFGDGHNDLPMLNMVGLPIVMGNALPEIKEVAKFVTKSNAENGIAHALEIHNDFKS